MAKIDLTKVEVAGSDSGEVQSLPRNKQINKDRYDLRIKSAQFKISKSKGSKMIEVDLEIYNPPTIKHHQDGRTYDVTGLSCKKYLMLEKPQDLAELASFMSRLGLAPEIDPENPDTEQFVGKCFSDIVSPATYENRTQATAEQLAADPNAKGAVILDPETGLPEISYGIQTGFGLGTAKKATKQPNAAF